MSISSEISRISKNISDSLDAVALKGVTVPSGSNSDDLPDLISQITSSSAISIVDTQDTAGGTIRTITAVDLSNDTVTAGSMLYGVTAHDADGDAVTGSIASKTSSDLTANVLTVTAPSGYYASNATKTLSDGNLVAGNIKKDVEIFGVTGSYDGGGGSSAQTATGTFTGNGAITAQISCSFAPDLVYVFGDLSGSATLRGVVSLTIIKDLALYVTTDGSQSSTMETLYAALRGISGYGSDLSEPHATYANNTLTLDMVNNTSQLRFTSGITYSYKLVKWT